MWYKNEHPINLRFHQENGFEKARKTEKTREKRRLKMAEKRIIDLEEMKSDILTVHTREYMN